MHICSEQYMESSMPVIFYGVKKNGLNNSVKVTKVDCLQTSFHGDV